jgi:hypothetical protein
MTHLLAESTSPVADTIQTIVSVLVFIIGALSVVMIIIGGLRYVSSGGDSGAISSAKNTIVYAISGIVFAVLFYAVTFFLIRWLVPHKGAGSGGVNWWLVAAISFGLFGLTVGGLAALRRSSNALHTVLRLAARSAAIWLPKVERPAYVERTHAMIVRAGRWERWQLVWDILVYAPGMGRRRRHARKLAMGKPSTGTGGN